jgi:hypothetical protein
MPRSRAAWPLENHQLHRRAASQGIAAPLVLDGPMNGDANSKSLKGSGSEVEPPAMPAYGVPITESTHP